MKSDVIMTSHRAKSCRYLWHKPRYSPLCLKFRCHGNQEKSG